MAVRVFLIALGGLLVGYMFMGRGFAHLGVPPLYVGEVVLFTGLAATGYAFLRSKVYARPMLIVWLLLGFMVLGLARTVPYLGVHGVDALRDAVLWGYALFALMIYFLADRALTLTATRLYGWVVPVFAVWLPICFSIFVALSGSIDTSELGSDVPLVVFKSGDMSVHVVGSIAFLVLAAGAVTSVRTFVWRAAITVPLLWAAFVAGAINRGGLLAFLVGLAAVAFLTRRWRNWMPVLAAPLVLVVAAAAPEVLREVRGFIPEPTLESSSPESAPASEGEAAPAGTSRPATSRSLVTNPGFELDAPDTDTINGWELVAGSTSIVSGGFRGANAALAQSDAGASATIRSTAFAIEGRDDLSVSVMVKAIGDSPTIEIVVVWYDASDAQLSRVSLNTCATGGVTDWQACAGVVRAPTDAAQAQIVLREAAGSATIGIDEVIVLAIPSRSLVTNPGFELGTPNSGTVAGWELIVGSGTIVEGGAYGGENFGSLQSGGGPYSAAIASTKFPITPAGVDLSVSLRVKAIVGSPRADVFVYWYDGSGAQLPSSALSTVSTARATGWQTSTSVVTAPADAAHAQIVLWEAIGGSAAMGIDEVIVKSGDFVARPPPHEGRPATIDQIVENIGSIFSSTDEGLEGTRRFRLRWWGAIIDYTVFGEHFWTGKGFGINLADADGFQTNEDRSLRAPHNSHLTALARMGVPGFVLWLLLQGAFGIGLLRSVFANRRAGDTNLAAVGSWILAYWVAMMVNTSFDPYLEGPQGGIWFWSLFGLGLVVMRLSSNSREA